MKYIKKVDPELADLIKKEGERQANTLMMIPSENIASYAVEEAVGSLLENKYAEGYPYKRYYQGQKYVDKIEALVIDRAKKIFKVEYANVQPYSGSPANFAVYNALLTPGDTIMGLALNFGGHLTHGSPASATSKYFKSVQYELDNNGLINYEKVLNLAKQIKPKIIIAGITAYPRKLDWQKFFEIAENVNAYLLCDISHLAGLIIGKAYPSPVPYSHIITTTTHKTLRGPRGAMILITKKGVEKDPELPKKIDRSVFPQLQGGPHINTIAGIGVALKEATKPNYKTYSKQIALMLDASKPGTILKLNLNELKEVSDKKGIAFEDVVKINENLVIVKLSDKGGSTYSFFNDIEVIAFSDEEYYIFTVDLKQANE